MIYSGCGICQALSNLLSWLPVPCPALDRQAGEQCTFPPLLGTTHFLEDSHIPCKCNDPPSPCPKSSTISRHREGIFLPFRDPPDPPQHPFHHRGQAEGRLFQGHLLSTLPAQISPSPEAVSACRAHRNIPSAHRLRLWGPEPAPALAEGFGEGSGMTTII